MNGFQLTADLAGQKSGSPSSSSLYMDTAPLPCSLDKDHKSRLTHNHAVSGLSTEIAGQAYKF